MQITLNGRLHETNDGLTIAELLQQLEMKPQYVAVERNQQLVPRAQHAQHRLQDGDRLEIVTLVGGG